MTDPYSISKDVYKVVEKLKSTVEQVSVTFPTYKSLLLSLLAVA